MHRFSALWQRNHPPLLSQALLGLAAVAIGIAGYLHGHLFWEGYAPVRVVGPLFWLNAVGSGVVIALLLVGRMLMFAVGGLMIALGSVISILISHSTSFFRFAEHRYDTRAGTIVIAEIVAVGLLVIALALARGGIASVAERGGMMRRSALAVIALVVLVGTGLVAAGVGQGHPPSALKISAAAKRREIAAVRRGSPEVLRGEHAFSSDGCADCHSLAAGSYSGRLGPRLDVQSQGDSVSAITQNIEKPPDDDKGYEAGLMPENFASRLSRADLRAIATYVHAAASAAKGGG